MTAWKLVDAVSKPLTSLMKQKGFPGIDLFVHWNDIVGPSFSNWTQPTKLIWHNKKTVKETVALVVVCYGAGNILLHHNMNNIVKKLNAYLGYEAIHSLKIIQKPTLSRQQINKNTKKILTKTETKWLDQCLGDMTDPEMIDIFRTFGEGILKYKKVSSGTD